MHNPRWQPYFKNFRSTFRFEELQTYIDYFRAAGFTIIRAENVSSIDPFVNRDEAISWFLGTWPHVHYLPKHLRREFMGEMIDCYLQKRPDACTDGVISFYWGHYELVAQKNP